MAAPTPTLSHHRHGSWGLTLCEVIWTAAAADNLSDEIVVNASDLVGGMNAKVLNVIYLVVFCSPGVALTVEFDDAGSDQLICSVPIGATSVAMDFTASMQGAVKTGLPKLTAGGTGDIVLTTRSAADGDELFCHIEWYAEE